MDILKAHEIIDKYIDFDALWKRTVGFYDREKYLGLRHWRKSAKYGISELKKAGIKTDVLEVPADGKTVALDNIMPWAGIAISPNSNLLTTPGNMN